MKNPNLLRSMVSDAFADEPETKTAAARPQVKIASGITSTDYVTKIAQALDFVADGIAKEAIGGSQWDQGPMAEAIYGNAYTDNLEGTEVPARAAGGVFGGDLPSDMIDQGSEIEVPYAPTDTFPLGGDQPAVDELAPSGTDAGGISYGEPSGAPDAMTAFGSAGRGKTDIRKIARMRADAAMARVLGKVKASAVRKLAQTAPETNADAAGPAPLPGPDAGTEPSTFQPIDNPLADAPQSMDALTGLTNAEADASRQDDLEATLGTDVVQAANADTSQEEALEHATGDTQETVTGKEALASILQTNVLTRIAQEGG